MEELKKQTILVVDDAVENIDIVVGLLKDKYKIKVATNGEKALKIAESEPSLDLILLDIVMPEMDGYEVITALKKNPETSGIPVIFLTGQTSAENETKGFEMGAVDYILKPFNFMVVQARVDTHLELILQRKKTEALLENILPKKVIQDLKDHGSSKPDLFENVTVLFSDLVDFTEHSSKIPPEELISELSEIFTAFDKIIERNGCERIKTIGDAYMAVSGMPEPDPSHAQNIVKSAIEMIDFLRERNKTAKNHWENRIGIHSGPLVGGIVGTKKYLYDVFGDAVNMASRVETSSEPLRISLSQSTHDLVSGDFELIPRGEIDLKGKGKENLYFVNVSS